MRIGQITLTPRENEWDCLPHTPVDYTTEQEQYNQEFESTNKYPDQTTQLEQQQNIESTNQQTHSRKSNTDDINNLLHYTAY